MGRLKLVTGGRRSGKTSELIRIAHEEGLYILAADRHRADCIFKQAREMGLDILYPVTPKETIRAFTGYRSYRNPYKIGVGKIIVDDVQDVLSHILEIEVRAMSVNVMDKDITSLHDDDERTGRQALRNLYF